MTRSSGRSLKQRTCKCRGGGEGVVKFQTFATATAKVYALTEVLIAYCEVTCISLCSKFCE